MQLLVVYGLVYLVIVLVLMLLGIGCGFLLHWIIPGVGVEMGIVTGAIVTGFSMDLLVRMVSAFKASEEEEEELLAELEKTRSRRPSRRKKV